MNNLIETEYNLMRSFFNRKFNLPLASLKSKAICCCSNNVVVVETCSCHGNDVICMRTKFSMGATVSKF